MKSFKMKALALATLGLGGLVMAGSAFAACPTLASGNVSGGGAGGGAWYAQSITSATMSIVSPGLDSTGCALSIAINSGAIGNAKGIVQDNSPQNEARYRARFYINTQALTNLTIANEQTKLFNVLASTGPAGLTTEEVAAYLVGSSPITVRFLVADTNSPGNTQTLSKVLP
ncbi:MAG: hypothetical protein KGK05_11350, partial [Xanthomonadaceae bacterium]|nr:hypothetical protein [Xanthomonadaceae bacterium]